MLFLIFLLRHLSARKFFPRKQSAISLIAREKNPVYQGFVFTEVLLYSGRLDRETTWYKHIYPYGRGIPLQITVSQIPDILFLFYFPFIGQQRKPYIDMGEDQKHEWQKLHWPPRVLHIPLHAVLNRRAARSTPSWRWHESDQTGSNGPAQRVIGVQYELHYTQVCPQLYGRLDARHISQDYIAPLRRALSPNAFRDVLQNFFGTLIARFS